MQALRLIHQLDRALAQELAPQALQGYTADELQQLYEALNNLQRHRRPIESAAGRAELAAFRADIDFLAMSNLNPST